jgi:polyisoprenoid-binding protein YceI
MKKLLRHLLLVLLLTVLNRALYAQQLTYELDPGKTKIEFMVSATMHTVHGSFQLKSGSIQFNPVTGEAGGLVVVDVKSGETGNNGRDRKMHREILQSERYPEASFKPTRISSGVDLKQSPTLQVEGVLTLHGADHPLTFAVPVHQSGDQLSTTLQFIVPYVQWGLKNPSTFILHVADTASMEISTSGRLVHAASGASQ